MMKNTTVIDRFMENHKEFCELNLERALYVFDGRCNELFVIEHSGIKDADHTKVYKTIVFNYCCGLFCGIDTEVGTMDKYFLMIPTSDFAEFKNFNDK